MWVLETRQFLSPLAAEANGLCTFGERRQVSDRESGGGHRYGEREQGEALLVATFSD